MRWLIILVSAICFFSKPVAAQEKPKVFVELPETQTILGQPFIVRIKILVPTWMPSPPDFPSLELPGLMVRLPERASQPISQRIGSETWSGVQRSYRIYPLQHGNFTITGRAVTIRYAVAGTIDAQTTKEPLPDIKFNVVIPKDARDLRPLIVARGFSLEAKTEGAPELDIGDALVRTITAKIEGTTPVLIPQLMPTVTGNNLREYSDEPKVRETEELGVLSGTREEQTTYLAQSEGAATLPSVRINWFNLETGKVETAEVPAVSLTIKSSPATGISPDNIPWRLVLGAVVVLILIAGTVRSLAPWTARYISERRKRWLASEPYAHRIVLKAIAQRDLGAVFTALDQWRTFFAPLPEKELESELTQLGLEQFSSKNIRPNSKSWTALSKSYSTLRRNAQNRLGSRAKNTELPALNPDWQS